MIVLAHLLMLGTPLAAQVHTTITLDASSLKKVDSPQDTASRAKTSPARMVSADLLRQPLPAKARQMLLKAQGASDAGDHTEALRLYTTALAKYPASAAWTQSLLGVEYLKTDRFEAAVASFDEAVMLLPHDAVNRSNLGLSLVLAGQYARAARELKQALELDPGNVQAKQLLDALQGKSVKSVAQAHE
jgi:tetratricopeptide (TPR) repeat protein